jgi:hypothetical protein
MVGNHAIRQSQGEYLRETTRGIGHQCDDLTPSYCPAPREVVLREVWFLTKEDNDVEEEA